jgi:hypothetical protein
MLRAHQSANGDGRQLQFPGGFGDPATDQPGLDVPTVVPHRAAMQSHEVMREVLRKTSAKKVSDDLGLSLSTIYKWAEEDEGDGSGVANPLDRVESLIKSTGDRRLVQWICERAGGFFILNPKTNKPHPDFLIPATNEVVQEFADLLAVIAAAAADNEVTKTEARGIRARWEDLKAVTEDFVACCEEGNFSRLKDRTGQFGTKP